MKEGRLRRLASRTLAAISLTGLCAAAFAGAPTGLTTEYRENPDGLDASAPRLS